MNRKNILVLDWSNLMFRSLYVNALYSNVATYDIEEDIASFIGKFTTDICSIIKIFRPYNIIIAKDAKDPWRKALLSSEITGYKSNRIKSDKINWENIYASSDELIEILSSQGFNVAYTEHGEADDIMALCKEFVWEDPNHEFNIIIVSADADIRQLIDFNKETNQFSIVYNTISKGRSGKRFMYVNQDFIDWLNTAENSIFSFADPDRAAVNSILTSHQNIELEIVNPNDIVLSKIFCGDDGDCVPSFYEYYKNGKLVRITPSKYKKIIESLVINNTKDLDIKKGLLKPILENVTKADINDIDIEERINRQRMLVELNSDLFPSEIRAYKETIPYIFKKATVLDYNKVSSRTLLNNTKFGKMLGRKSGIVEREVFNDISAYADKLNKLF